MKRLLAAVAIICLSFYGAQASVCADVTQYGSFEPFRILWLSGANKTKKRNMIYGAIVEAQKAERYTPFDIYYSVSIALLANDSEAIFQSVSNMANLSSSRPSGSETSFLPAPITDSNSTNSPATLMSVAHFIFGPSQFEKLRLFFMNKKTAAPLITVAINRSYIPRY